MKLCSNVIFRAALSDRSLGECATASPVFYLARARLQPCPSSSSDLTLPPPTLPTIGGRDGTPAARYTTAPPPPVACQGECTTVSHVFYLARSPPALPFFFLRLHSAPSGIACLQPTVDGTPAASLHRHPPPPTSSTAAGANPPKPTPNPDLNIERRCYAPPLA
jgi:hypothetical protein